MEKSVKERLKFYLLKNNIKQTEFCRTINVSSGFISGMRESIQPDKLKSIAINYPELDIKWLLTGVTEKVQSHIETTNTNDKLYEMTTEPISEYLPTSNFKLLPLHSFDVVGGSHNQESDTMGYIMGYMPFVNAKDGDISVLVTGNSMYPTYPAGSYVQIRKIDYWREFLEFGQVHIIELMDDRRLIKEVRKGSDKKHLRLISHNENFDEVEISIDFVRSVWLVLAKYEKSVM